MGVVWHSQRSEAAPCAWRRVSAIPFLKGDMMNMQDILTAITTVGFPIVACIALFWQNSKMSETISHNTEAILELTTIIKERLKDGD